MVNYTEKLTKLLSSCDKVWKVLYNDHMREMNEILTRGVANIISNQEELQKLLDSGKKLNIYMGIDPTATKIHLGHAVPLRKLQAFADMGHNVTFLIGDFTALIGDTSDKDTERPMLTSEQIEENFQTYKEQASKVLDFSKIKVAHNSEWLGKLNFAEIVKLCQHFSFGDFASRELVKKRLSEGKYVGLHEGLYPVMQGYDSYHLDTDVQIGGTDQTFNMQAGRKLQKDLRSKDSYVLATEFLTGTDGRKMSKSWGNAIWLDDTSTDMFGKVMSVKDDLILEYFTLATTVPNDKIEEIKKKLESNENPMDLKKELAVTIVSELYSKEEAKKAQDEFQRVVQNKEVPTDIPTINTYPKDTSLSTIAIEHMGVQSLSEWKRLVDQGGVYWNNERIQNANLVLEEEGIFKIGKRMIAKVELSS